MSAEPTTRGVWAELERSAGRRRTNGEPGGIWAGLRERFDPATFRPKLAEDVELKEFQLRWGNDYAMIRNPRELVHFRLTPDEVATVRLMDGTRSLQEIIVTRLRESGDLEVEGVADLVRDLQSGRFLEPINPDMEVAVSEAMSPSVAARKLKGFLKTLSIDWAGAERLVRFFYRFGGRMFFSPAAVVVGSVLSVAGLIAFVGLVRGGEFSLSTESLALEFLIILAMNYVLTFLHELGHALAVVHFGRRVKSAGFMIYFGSPAFFVESSDALMLSRRERIVQAFAGPFAELMVAGAASLYAVLFPDTVAASILYKFAVLNYFVIFMNLIPLLELDGYWILSDLIQVPDLRPRSLSFVRYDLLQKVRKRERLSKAEVGLTLYGIVGLLFAAFSFYGGFFFWRQIFGSLIEKMWNGGIVTRVLLLLLGALVAGPVVRGTISLGRLAARRIRGVARDIRFRFERSWRVQAAEMIDKLPLFEDVPVEILNELAGRVRLRTVAPGQPVFRQGERADAFYVVRAGTLEIVEEDPETATQRVIRTLAPGDSFGELGLLLGAPRAATVRGLTEAELFVVDKGTFDAFLADMAEVPSFGPTLQAVAELRQLPPFAHLQAGQLAELLEHGEWVTLPPGEEIITQGDVGDSFWAIGSGQVEVLKDGERIAVEGPGTYVGEVALLLDVPRTATVRTLTPVRAYRLDRDGFESLVATAFHRGTLATHGLLAERTQHH